MNPFIALVGVMNLAAAIWYWSQGSTRMAMALCFYFVAGLIQSTVSVS